MIRTTFSMDELHKIFSYPTCPCIDYCKDVDDHWDMWQPIVSHRDHYWLASLHPGITDDDTGYYKYKDHIFACIWEGVSQSEGEVYRYVKSIERDLYTKTFVANYERI